MLFLGMANAYVMRTNMSVAIVAMVNHTFVEAGHKEIFDDECPNYLNTTSSVSVIVVVGFLKKKNCTYTLNTRDVLSPKTNA